MIYLIISFSHRDFSKAIEGYTGNKRGGGGNWDPLETAKPQRKTEKTEKKFD